MDPVRLLFGCIAAVFFHAVLSQDVLQYRPLQRKLTVYRHAGARPTRVFSIVARILAGPTVVLQIHRPVLTVAGAGIAVNDPMRQPGPSTAPGRCVAPAGSRPGLAWDGCYDHKEYPRLA